MSLGGKIIVGLATLAGAVLVAAPAHADEPFVSVNSITFTPGGGEVVQTITYRGLPEHSKIHYDINRDWGGFSIRRSDGASCAMPASSYADCSELSGSGAIYVGFGSDIPSAVPLSSAQDVATVEVRIESLSLLAIATVTAAPRADLAVTFNAASGSASVTVFNYGPSVSGKETLRITGFIEPVYLSTSSCELDGLVVVCYLAELATTPPGSAPTCAMSTSGRYRTCHSYTLTLNSRTPQLTATVSGPVSDPDLSNNSKVVFANSTSNQPPPPASPVAGGGAVGVGGSGSGAAGSMDALPGAVAGPDATSSVDATPAADVTPPTGVTISTPATHFATSGRTTDRSAQAIAVAVAVGGFVVGLGLGGGAGLIAWRRFRSRSRSRKATGVDADLSTPPHGPAEGTVAAGGV